MSVSNQVSLIINTQAQTAIQEALEIIKSNLPDLISLTNDERQMLPKMGDKTVAFVNKSLEYAQQNPKVVPNFLDMAEFKKDVDLVNVLFQILAPIQKLAEELDDTIMLAGSEAYLSSRSFYKALKIAIDSGETGLKNIHDDLSARFPGRNLKKP